MHNISLSFCLCLVKSSELTYNAALNRPAYQSSLYSNGAYPPNLANDGSRETHADRCSISQSESNPWWAIDLGRPTTIYRVYFTNRGDGPFGTW